MTCPRRPRAFARPGNEGAWAARNPARSVWTEVGGIRTHALVMGAGPPLVLVPGLACAHFYFHELQTRLAGHFQVWAYDPPGHGYSRAPAGTFLTLESLADHLAAWLRANGLRGVPLLGHSLGGDVLLHLAARWPGGAGCLVLCAPGSRPGTPGAPGQLLRLVAEGRQVRARFLVRLARSYLHAGPRRAWGLLTHLRQADPREVAPRVRASVMILEGTADDIVRSRALRVMQDHLPRARLVRVPGATHALIDGQAGNVARLVRAFVRQTAASRR
ncbi:alpha/beta fold hydrolase [Deinococcus planocerae]|uniref:alpha/beta fold hydrolase n=1 Tax=Deinococcus planocerae TaxID=1737569 RepID=UPI0011AFB66F|nr:alpha/beta fold hydrolase [Deinococcus planocerae]